MNTQPTQDELDAVAQLCGLLPPREWLAAEFNNPERDELLDPSRRSGRTTRVLIEAAWHLVAGRRVRLVAFSPEYAHSLCRELSAMLARPAWNGQGLQDVARRIVPMGIRQATGVHAENLNRGLRWWPLDDDATDVELWDHHTGIVREPRCATL